METRLIGFYQWCKENNKTTYHDIDSHIMAGLRSMPQTWTFKEAYEKELFRLQHLVQSAKDEWREMIAGGTVIDPWTLLNRKEQLEVIAKGCPDNECVKAARRLLMKDRYQNKHRQLDLFTPEKF